MQQSTADLQEIQKAYQLLCLPCLQVGVRLFRLQCDQQSTQERVSAHRFSTRQHLFADRGQDLCSKGITSCVDAEAVEEGIGRTVLIQVELRCALCVGCLHSFAAELDNRTRLPTEGPLLDVSWRVSKR